MLSFQLSPTPYVESANRGWELGRALQSPDLSHGDASRSSFRERSTYAVQQLAAKRKRSRVADTAQGHSEGANVCSKARACSILDDAVRLQRVVDDDLKDLC